VDRAFGDREADVGIRLHRPEGFANVAKFYGWLHSDLVSVNIGSIHSQKRIAPDKSGAMRFVFKIFGTCYG
jgi:hypothetical protein